MKKTLLLIILITFFTTTSQAQAKIEIHSDLEIFANEILIMLANDDEKVRQAGISKWEQEINNRILFYVFCTSKSDFSCNDNKFTLPSEWEDTFSHQMVMSDKTYKIVTALADSIDTAREISIGLHSDNETIASIAFQMWKHSIIHLVITLRQNGVDP